jgi:hypothetical protein
MKDSLNEDDISQIKISFEKYLEINDRKTNLKDEESIVKEEVAKVIEGGKREAGKMLKIMKEKYDKGESETDAISTLVDQVQGRI